MWDVLVVGGGPAGLSAALVLGRCRRRVLVCDVGRPRNRHSGALHGYLTRDGTAPVDFNALGRQEVARYGVEFRQMQVDHVCPRQDEAGGFDVTLEGGGQEQAHYVLIASGVSDEVPPIAGIRACYGRSVFHCPYCDGWEWRDRRLGVLENGVPGARLALSLKTWSASVTLFPGRSRLDRRWRDRLARNDISVAAGPVAALEHEDGLLRRVRLESAAVTEVDAIFFTTPQRPQSLLAQTLGCRVNRKGTVETGLLCDTNVPGVYVAGDASHDAQYVVVAAAEGLKAALAINQAMQQTELRP